MENELCCQHKSHPYTVEDSKIGRFSRVLGAAPLGLWGGGLERRVTPRREGLHVRAYGAGRRGGVRGRTRAMNWVTVRGRTRALNR
jgi:hypothetical protein